MQVVRIQRDVYSLKDFIQRHPDEIAPCSVGNTSAVEVVEKSVWNSDALGVSETDSKQIKKASPFYRSSRV